MTTPEFQALKGNRKEWDATRGEADRREALWLVNQIRETVGLPRLSSLRAGDLGKSDRCAIAASLDEIGAVDVTDYRVQVTPMTETYDLLRDAFGDVNAVINDRFGPLPYPDAFEVRLPRPVTRFVIDFDDMRHPDLDKGLQELRRMQGYTYDEEYGPQD